MYTAYIGYYPARNILKTWKSLGVTSRSPDEAVRKGIEVRDQFLLDNEGRCDLHVDVVARKGGKPCDGYEDARALIQFMDANKIDRSRFPKRLGGTAD